MLGPIRFVFVIIWFAIGLSIVGTLKDATVSMSKEAAIAHKHGGISYGWWNRALLDGKVPLNQATHIPALAGSREDKNEKNFGRRNPIPRPKQ